MLGFCVQPLPFTGRTLKGCLCLENEMNQGRMVQIAQEMVPWRQILTMIGQTDGRKNINHKEIAYPLTTIIEITNVTETNQCHI